MRPSYPFAPHALSLLPSVAALLAVRFAVGPDTEVFSYFTGIRAAHPSLTFPVRVFTDGALFLFYPLYACFFLRGLRGKSRDDLLFAVSYALAQALVAVLLCRVVKVAVGRPRPMTGGPFAPFSFGWGYQSFPSGHTTEILGSGLPFLWRYGARARHYILPLGLGLVFAAVAFSRIYLGMHHPTDIWGGLVFGSLSGYVSWTFYGALQKRWRQRTSG